MTGEMPMAANSFDKTNALARLAEKTAAVERGFTPESAELVHTILIRGSRNVPHISGNLLRSLVRKGDRAHVWKVEPNRLQFGTTLEYGYRAEFFMDIDSNEVAKAVAKALFSSVQSVQQ